MKPWERRARARKARRGGAIYIPDDLIQYDKLKKNERQALDAGNFEDAVDMVARRLDIRSGWVSAILRKHKPVHLNSLPIGIDSVSIASRGENIVVSVSVDGRPFEIINSYVGPMPGVISESVMARGIRRRIHRDVDRCDQGEGDARPKACTKRNHV